MLKLGFGQSFSCCGYFAPFPGDNGIENRTHIHHHSGIETTQQWRRGFMPHAEVENVTRHLLGSALLVAVVVILGFAICWRARRRRAPLFPLLRRTRREPWIAAEVILALLLMTWMPLAVFSILDLTGFFRWHYGAGVTQEDTKFMQRGFLWAAALGYPLTVLAIIGMLRVISRTQLPNVGLTSQRWLPSVAGGVLSWLVVAPPVFGLHFLLVWAQERFGLETKKHALEVVLEPDARPIEWGLVVIVAVVWAPVLEELVFRGILQPWLARRPWRWVWAWGAALAVAGLHGKFSLDFSRAVLESQLPLLFIGLAGVLAALASASESGPTWRWQGILGSSLLFAAFHTGAWPSPVPLFFLAIALGWLADRSRGLVGPITLHALFNAVSTILLVMGWAAD
jgi:membrane protease YdiL (CAAX protease family)